MELDDETLEMLLLLLLTDGEGQTADELMEAVNRALPALPAKPESEELDECRRTPWRDLHAGRVHRNGVTVSANITAPCGRRLSP